jgi:CcmD family protein
MTTLGYLFAGFALAWGVSFGYLWHLGRKASSLQRQIDAVEQRVRERSGDGSLSSV